MSDPRRNLFLLLFGGLAVWGLVLAAGVTIYGGYDWRKGAIVAACVAVFMLFWGLLLAIRRRRTGGSK